MATLGPNYLYDNGGAEEYFRLIDETAYEKGVKPGEVCPWTISIIERDGSIKIYRSSEVAVIATSRFGSLSFRVFPGPDGKYNGLRPVTSESQGVIVNIFGYDKEGGLHLLLIKEMRQSIAQTPELKKAGLEPVPDSAGKYLHYQEWHPPMGFSEYDPLEVSRKINSISDTVNNEVGEETGLSPDSLELVHNYSTPINMNAACNSSHNSHVVSLRLKGNIEDFQFNPKSGELVTGFKWFSIRELKELMFEGVHDNALLRSGPAMGAIGIFLAGVDLAKIK